MEMETPYRQTDVNAFREVRRPCFARVTKHNAHSIQLFKNEVRISFVYQTAVYKSLVWIKKRTLGIR